MYKLIRVSALFIAPLAPALFFGWRAYAELVSVTGTPWLAVPGGVAAAAALEIVGALAGHTAITLHRQRDSRYLSNAGNDGKSQMSWDYFQFGAMLASKCQEHGVEYGAKPKKAKAATRRVRGVRKAS